MVEVEVDVKLNAEIDANIVTEEEAGKIKLEQEEKSNIFRIKVEEEKLNEVKAAKVIF